MSWTMPAAMVIPNITDRKATKLWDLFTFSMQSGFAGLITTTAASPAFMKSGFSVQPVRSLDQVSSILPWSSLRPVLYDMQDWRISNRDSRWMLQYYDLGCESSATHGGLATDPQRLRVWYLFSQRLLRSIRCYRPALLLWSPGDAFLLILLHDCFGRHEYYFISWLHYSGLNSSTGTVPIPEMVYASWTGMRSGNVVVSLAV